MSEITVQYERKFSDGNYGSEGVSFAWAGTYEDDDPLVIGAKYAQIVKALRTHVLEQLAQSAAGAVARAAQWELKLPSAEKVTELEDMPF